MFWWPIALSIFLIPLNYWFDGEFLMWVYCLVGGFSATTVTFDIPVNWKNITILSLIFAVIVMGIVIALLSHIAIFGHLMSLLRSFHLMFVPGLVVLTSVESSCMCVALYIQSYARVRYEILQGEVIVHEMGNTHSVKLERKDIRVRYDDLLEVCLGLFGTAVIFDRQTKEIELLMERIFLLPLRKKKMFRLVRDVEFVRTETPPESAA